MVAAGFALAIPSTAKAQYYNGYSDCTYHAYKLCVGNSIYWYDSCGAQQDIYSNCTNGLVCQYGQCTTYVPVVPPQPQPINNYNAYSKVACFGNSIYWYDSLGVVSGLYKNCQDKNSCTQDTCSGNQCLNTTKCDGTTCTVGSADYIAYCQPAQPITPAQPVQPTTPVVQPAVQNTTPAVAAAVSTTPATSGFWGFIKRWYLWILGALILILLFVVVFKRLSSEE